MSYPWTTVDESDSDVKVVGGSGAVTYQVELRVRLLAELKNHTGGTTIQQYVKRDGAPTNDGVGDVVKLEVSNPSHIYYLNVTDGVPPPGAAALDYQLTLPIVGGATLTLTVLSIDGMASQNVVIGTSNFDGIFAQVDYTTSELVTQTTLIKSGGSRGFEFKAWAETIDVTPSEK